MTWQDYKIIPPNYSLIKNFLYIWSKIEIMKVEIEQVDLEKLKEKAQSYDVLAKIVEDAYTNDTGDLCTIGEDICRALGWL